ncbi:protocatechuate 3,4-dioxygenase subunit alpha [Spirosoma arcticum]
METERLRQTPSQTLGPFSAYSLTAEQYGYPYNSIIRGSLISEATPGQYADNERIYITGRVHDGNSATIVDALVELWQADAEGTYRSLKIEKVNEPHFTGFGRLGTGTNPEHRYTFTTVKPGAINEASAPHINVILFMRGSLRHLYTRLYFSDEAVANQKDALLNAVPEDRRSTLIAHKREQNGLVFYDFDIYVQGDRETVFFDV